MSVNSRGVRSLLALSVVSVAAIGASLVRTVRRKRAAEKKAAKLEKERWENDGGPAPVIGK